MSELEIELDLTDIRKCERHLKCTHSSQKSLAEYGEYNNQLYSNFIDDEIFVCDMTFRPLDLDGLRNAFKYWITCTCRGYNKYQFSELVELITKKFGKKELKGWSGIRVYTLKEQWDCMIREDDSYINAMESKNNLSIYEPEIRKPCILCEHGKCNKLHCKMCVRNSRLCEHKIRKSYCKICDGSKLCQSSWCHTSRNKKYEGYCMPCFVNNPVNMLNPLMRNHKTKEKEVVDYVIRNYPKFTWVADRRVQDGCSRRRPDLLLDMGSHIIIVEIDENKHSGYDCSCENKRLMEISQDLQHRPIVFIRFNPDSYRDQTDMLVKSCWKLNKIGVMSIISSKRDEWNERLETLNKQIQYWIDNISEKIVEIVELFY